MPTLIDIFSGDAFSAVSLTRAVNIVPNTYGRLQQLNLFPAEPIPTSSVAVQFVNGVLNLLPTRERGAPPSLGMPERRNVRVFKTFHIPHDDMVLAEDVQNMLARSGNGLDSVQDAVNRKLLRMRSKHGITLEHLRCGALRGAVLDSDGSTLLNLFTTFGVTEKVVFFDLGNASADVPGKISEVLRHIEDNLLGDTMTSVHALCSRTFFDAITSHPKVVNAYQFFAAQQNLLREDVRKGFTYKGVTFEDYGGAVANALNEDGTTTVRRFVPEGDARFFPLGTMDTFQTYFAPPDVITEVNSEPSDEVYADQAVDPKFERYVELHTQSNPLPIVKRPAVLVRGNLAAA